jgi:TonB-dependent starch-binding outer membrane protein SusC
MKKTRTASMYCLWAIICALMLCSNGFAQTSARRLNGKVLNKMSDEPVPLATITVKGTQNKVATNETGSFSIDAKAGDVLVISSVGFANKEVKVGNAASIDIRLEQDYNRMEDVIIVGYGKMKKTDLSSSQVTVTAADIQKTVNTSFDQALQGRAANVYVSSNSGQPGAAPSVIIRGFNSINGTNQPLYVIDGVQFKPDDATTENNYNPRNAGSSALKSGVGANFLANINPDDIETINVLQGPSATSIYGAAGANGVIMVTTKRGRAGDTKVSLNSLFSLQDLPKFADVMNLREWATYRNAYSAAGAATAQPEFADPSVLGEGTNWQKELFRRTLLHKDVLSLSGGSDKTTFYVSGEYFKQEGVAVGSGFNRYSLRLNLDNQARKWLKIGTNLNVSQTKEIINTSNGDIINTAIGQNPSVTVKNPDGSWGGPVNTQFQYTNPVAIASINDNNNKSLAFTGGLYADVTFLKNFTFHVDANGYMQNYKQYSFNPSYTFGGYKNTTTVSFRTRGENYWWGLNQRLQYQTKIGKHAITAMAGHEAQENGWESLFGQRSGYLVNSIPELSAGSTLTEVNNSAKGASSKESWLGRLNYVFDGKYIVQFTYRADASSNFGPNYKWGYFPSLSAAWRISEESFMRNAGAVNDLKLRVEYGESGNENATGYYATLASVPVPFGGGTGFLPSVYDNPNLHWETTKTFDIGFDLHMFNNRLEVIVDAYQKDISDLLTRSDHSYTLGGAVSYDVGSMQWPTTNVGSMRNRGIGITINTVNIEKPLVWKTGINFSLDRNKITYLDQGTPFNTIYKRTSVATISAVGDPAALFTGYIADGIFTDIKDIQTHAVQTATGGVRTINPATGTWVGDIKFRDQNNDGIINEKDRVVLGNPWPKFTMGFNNALSYRNFDLNIFFYGSFGNDVYNYLRYRNENTGGTAVYSNLFKSVANFARPSNTDATQATATLLNPGFRIARIAPGDPNGNNRATQWYLEDGSYIRCRNISLSYNIPGNVLARTSFIKGAKVTVNAQNLFTITNYSGLDPEMGQNGSLMFGIDDGRYPTSRMYSFNLVLDF